MQSLNVVSPVMATEIQVLDNLCKVLYESTDNASRLQAEQNLAELAASPECLQRCTLLLQSGTVPYAQLVASNTLMKLLTSKTGIGLPQRLELCTYLLNYLGERSLSLPPFVVTSLCQLFARLTKQGWLDYDLETHTFPFREPVDKITKLAEENISRRPLAIQLLALLISEVNSMSGLENMSKQRKIASHFRDSHLLDIFKLATNMLENCSSVTMDEQQLQLISGLLQLSLSCLTFDFIGSFGDETNDDNVTVQAPTLWRIVFIDGHVISMFFHLYDILPDGLSGKVLQNIVQLSSLRRTLFSNSERQVYLAELVRGVKSIMDHPEKLRRQESFHEFCRIISRLKSNYQLSELIKVEEYSQLIPLLADFTEQSLRAFEFSSNSTYYLLSFWQRMVSSVPYLNSTDPHLLDVYCPKITAAFVESRLDYARAVVRGEVSEDPLDDQGSVQQVMEQVAIICRCEYEKSAELFARLFDRDLVIYERMTASSTPEAATTLSCLTWLVTIIGAAVQGKASFSVCDELDLIDVDLICRALKLMQLSDSRLAAGVEGCLKLERAFLYMLEQFRKVYVSDQVQSMNRIYEKLGQLLGIQDESEMLTVYVRKIITNLKYWSREEKLIENTLSLLNELSLGYTAARRLVRLPDIQLLLNNHTSEHFSFLSATADLQTMRCRTMFYSSLMRLLSINFNEDDAVFASFMQPLTDAIREICSVFALKTPEVDQEHLKRAVIGMCRDIRGIASAISSQTVYTMLFDWM
ncbi:hypothetical protein AB6A40_009607 [Gnathostoma spinigerum]|uniref:Importin N-terminal domain-containing protein n=1 Tax=Gnathostoma spinigerum TaxID=75299 RepID=A0ABD6ESG7_9BILA